MANQKITDLSASGALTLDDLIEVVDDPAGSAVNKKATLTQLQTLLSGRVLLDQKTAAASTSLDFTTVITTVYDSYEIELLNIIPTTNAVTLSMRFSTNGGSSYDSGSNYSQARVLYSSAAFNASGGSNGITEIFLGGTLFNTAAPGGYTGRITLHTPLNGVSYPKYTVRGGWKASNDSNWYSLDGFGAYITTTPVNAFQFFLTSGTIASGVIRVYGVKK